MGTVKLPVPVWRSGENFSPIPWRAPPPLGSEIIWFEEVPLLISHRHHDRCYHCRCPKWPLYDARVRPRPHGLSVWSRELYSRHPNGCSIHHESRSPHHPNELWPRGCSVTIQESFTV